MDNDFDKGVPIFISSCSDTHRIMIEVPQPGTYFFQAEQALALAAAVMKHLNKQGYLPIAELDADGKFIGFELVPREKQ